MLMWMTVAVLDVLLMAGLWRRSENSGEIFAYEITKFDEILAEKALMWLTVRACRWLASGFDFPRRHGDSGDVVKK